MDWQQYIHSDTQILLGKPTVKCSRLSVEFLLSLFAAGWTQQQVLENYPTTLLSPFLVMNLYVILRQIFWSIFGFNYFFRVIDYPSLFVNSLTRRKLIYYSYSVS